MNDDDRICPRCERGQHIDLTCRNHPDLRWSTKNVGGYIGARKVFYNLSSAPDMGPECPCPMRDLHHVHPGPIDLAHVNMATYRQLMDEVFA